MGSKQPFSFLSRNVEKRLSFAKISCFFTSRLFIIHCLFDQFNCSTAIIFNFSIQTLSSFCSHVINVLGIQKVYLIAEIMGGNLKSCCSDQNEKTLAFFWNQSELVVFWFQKKLMIFSFWSAQHDFKFPPIISAIK